MKQFKHPNVMNLTGVCMDAGPAPYIVMPFMANGSLLSYLRKERQNLFLSETADEDLVRIYYSNSGSEGCISSSESKHVEYLHVKLVRCLIHEGVNQGSH